MKIDPDKIYNETIKVPNSTLIARDTIEKVGLMDDALFSTLADEDYVRRMNKIGLQARVLLDAIIYHKVKYKASTLARKLGMTNPGRAYIIARNRTIIIDRYGKWYQELVFLFFWQQVFNAYYLFALLFKIRDNKLTSAYFKGLFHAWRYVFTKKLPPLEYVLDLIED